MAISSVAEGEGADRKLASCAAAWSEAHRVPMGRWRVRYREAGSGPVVVLLHGLGVSADYWWRNGPPIAAAGYRVLAPDLPGFGLTEGPPDGLSIGEQAQALAQWVEVMGIGRAVFVGHSLSCQTILRYAVTEPDRTAGLILAAPSGDPVPHRLVRQAVGLLRDSFRESWKLKIVVAQAYLRAGPFRTWKTWTEAAHDDALATAATVQVPALVVLGDRDPVVRPEFARALAEQLSGTLSVIPGGAHAVIFDTAEAFNAAALAWMRGNAEW